jgi:tetratricopeptide (TPR) repeat protein
MLPRVVKFERLWILVLIALCGVAMGTHWPDLVLSVLTPAVLRPSLMAWVPARAELAFTDAKPLDSTECGLVLALADGREQAGLSASTRRLIRFASLSCERDAAIVQRFERESQYGLKPSEFDALYVGEAMSRIGYQNEALALRQSVPQVGWFYIELGRIAIEQLGDESRGLALFALADETSSSFDPRRVNLYRYRCLISLRDGRDFGEPDPCISFEQAGTNWLSTLLLGRRYYNEGRFEQAIPLFNASIEFKRDAGDTYYWLGKSLFAIGDWDAAESVYRKALKYAADYPWNYVGLAEVEIHKGCSATGRIYLNQAALLGGDDVKRTVESMLQGTSDRDDSADQCK